MSWDETEVAYHEAGHAVAARILGRPVNTATVIADERGGSAGHVEHDFAQNLNELEYELGDDEEEDADIERKRQVIYEHEAMIALAGCAAQRRYLGDRADEEALHEGAYSDRQFVLQIFDKLVGLDDELRIAWWKVLELRTDRLLERQWPAVEHLASCLLDRKTLTGEEVDECIADASLPPEHRGKSLTWQERLAILANDGRNIA
jgi:hypothetical protein